MLRDDVIHVIRSVYGEADLPSLIVVGHSMGGAVATHVAASKAFGSGLKALVVVDVVEGTAVEALPAMVDIIRKRPKTFASVSDAIEWRSVYLDRTRSNSIKLDGSQLLIGVSLDCCVVSRARPSRTSSRLASRSRHRLYHAKREDHTAGALI